MAYDGGIGCEDNDLQVHDDSETEDIEVEHMLLSSLSNETEDIEVEHMLLSRLSKNFVGSGRITTVDVIDNDDEQPSAGTPTSQKSLAPASQRDESKEKISGKQSNASTSPSESSGKLSLGKGSKGTMTKYSGDVEKGIQHTRGETLCLGLHRSEIFCRVFFIFLLIALPLGIGFVVLFNNRNL
mmetsp:Transcript_3022/g.4059  ORF Transcript_3022/g.4059 Transcript_3022/m.4059 type:complete len:184 (+) Transcript_3022:147-698(+)